MPDLRVVSVGAAPDGPQLRVLAGVLSSAERERVARLRTPGDRARAVAGRGGVRLLLGAELGVDPAALHLGTAPSGKPHLEPVHGGNLRFNVTHSGELALVALSWGAEVGVDVEQVPLGVPPGGDAGRGRGIDVVAVASRFFSVAERAAIQAVPPAERQLLALECWVRKEACLKVSGEGLRAPLDAVDVIQPGQPFADRVGTCAVIGLAVPPGYRAALAVEREFPAEPPVVQPLVLDAEMDVRRVVDGSEPAERPSRHCGHHPSVQVTAAETVSTHVPAPGLPGCRS